MNFLQQDTPLKTYLVLYAAEWKISSQWGDMGMSRGHFSPDIIIRRGHTVINTQVRGKELSSKTTSQGRQNYVLGTLG